MDGSCNDGTLLLKQKGWYKNFQVWLNEQGTVKLLTLPMLEDAGYKVEPLCQKNNLKDYCGATSHWMGRAA